jgi:hypothetical protein
LDHPIRPRPRYGYDNPLHPELDRLISQHEAGFAVLLQELLRFRDDLHAIPVTHSPGSVGPWWGCGWLPALDAFTLYGLIRRMRPARYLEVGSGCSTKFARKAVDDEGLPTQIISIDPAPRDDVDAVCDVVLRQPLEEVDLAIVDELEAGDFLFIDGSHRCFTNSDATVVFLDVLPRLRTDVHVGIHDIYLPWDYPPWWNDRFYSEQYLLAAYLLGGARVEIVLANWFVHNRDDLRRMVDPLWAELNLEGHKLHGSCFWMKTK